MDPSSGEKNVPRGRLARIFGIGKLAAGLAGDLAGAAGKLAGGSGRDAAEERFHRRAAERMLSALGRMKGLPMKLGQMLSYIDDFIPPAYRDIYAASLRKLQVKAHPMRWAELESVIEQDLGAKPDAFFASFEREPIAAASIGQVYRASLADGREVAVKVQYPGIGQAIQNDLKNIHTLRSAFAMILPKLDVERSLQDITDRVSEECDYGCELNNQLDFQGIWQDDAEIMIPQVYEEFCGDHVLVSEYVEGLRWEQMLETCDAAQKNQYGQVIYRFVFGSLHGHGIFNGDPHPGNYLFLEGGRVAFLDFGCVQRFQDATITAFLEVRTLACAGVRGEELRAAMARAYGLPTTLDDEEWEFLETYILLLLKPGMGGVFRFDRDFTRQVYKLTVRASTLFARKALSKGVWEAKQPGLVFLNRIQYGLYSILATLEAEADWQRVLGGSARAAGSVGLRGALSRADDHPARAPGSHTPAWKLARLLGWVLHPFVIAVPVGVLAVIHELGSEPSRLLELAFLASALSLGPALLWIAVLYRLGWIGRDLLLVRRENRPWVYPVMMLSFALDAELLFARWLPFELGRALAWAACAVCLAMLLANYASKVSLHCAGNAGILTGVALVYGSWALALVWILPLVAWARWTTGNHTLAQVIAGSLLGALPVILVLVWGFPQVLR